MSNLNGAPKAVGAKVAVIGAGSAGLVAAKELLEKSEWREMGLCALVGGRGRRVKAKDRDASVRAWRDGFVADIRQSWEHGYNPMERSIYSLHVLGSFHNLL